MTKADLLALANRGPADIGGVSCTVVVRDSAGNNGPWLDIFVEQFTPFVTSLILGQKWVEYLTDDECAELPAALQRYKQHAIDFESRAKAKVMRLKTDGINSLIDLDGTGIRPGAYKKMPLIDGGFYIPGISTIIELDGVTYAPVWSYWLDCACYMHPANDTSLLCLDCCVNYTPETVAASPCPICGSGSAFPDETTQSGPA